MLTALDHFEMYFQTLQARALRRSIATRSANEALAYEMAAGNYHLTPGDGVPEPTSPDAELAFKRIQSVVTCAGPKVLRSRLHGTVKDVTWGDTEDQTLAAEQSAQAPAGKKKAQTLDDRLAALKLHELAARGYEQLLVTGMVAFWAHKDAQGVPRLTRLSGYLEPLPSTVGDVDSVGGLLQVWQVQYNRWNVRIYDLEDNRMREWQNLRDAVSAFGVAPDLEVNLAAPPRIGVSYQDAAGLPIGEFVQGRNLIRAEMASQFKVKRLEELYAFPVPVVEGAVDFPKVWGPGQPVRVNVGGSFRYAEPAGLDRMAAGLDRDQAAIRDFFSLPVGVLGGDWPSGEALYQANIRYNVASRYYGTVLGQPLAQAVQDYAALLRLVAPAPEILPDLMGEAKARWAIVGDLYDKGIIPLGAAARAVQDAVPGWSDEDLEEFVAEHEGHTSPGQVQKVMDAMGASQDPKKAGGAFIQDSSQEAQDAQAVLPANAQQ